MPTTFCNKCGHKNPTGSNFCSSCGAVLEIPPAHDTTITFHPDLPVDAGEDLSIDLAELSADVGLLVVKRGPKSGSRFALQTQITAAGRHPESEIFLDDVTVSRRHAEFERSADGYIVRDAGSLNGTYVNRERIEERALENGDEVQVGKFKLVFFQS